jgi:ABC-type Fe3+/spermidine/putrescine transport system ATPase subunit
VSSVSEVTPMSSTTVPDGPSDALVDVRGARKLFGSFEAVSDVSFTVRTGTFTTLLGASGSGKTTMLRLVAGLENLDSGSILMNSKVVASARPRVHVPPEKRRVGFVFQSFALWPHMRVFDQVAYPLKVRRDRARMRERVMSALSLVGLAHLADRYPSELSGGQQQRVSVARALVYEPAVLLLDEPLSALDAELRVYMRAELQALHRRLGVTMVYVTHDQSEALSLSDEVVLMSAGKIIERGSPRQIYDSPTKVETAKFVGGSNVLSGTIRGAADSSDVSIALDCGTIVTVAAASLPGSLTGGSRVAVAVKPEDVVLESAKGDVEANRIQAQVQNVSYSGSHTEIILDVQGESFSVRTDKSMDVEVGTPLCAWLRSDALCIFAEKDEEK